MLRPYGAKRSWANLSCALEENGGYYSPELIQSLEHRMTVIGGSNFSVQLSLLRKEEEEERRRSKRRGKRVTPLDSAKARGPSAGRRKIRLSSGDAGLGKFFNTISNSWTFIELQPRLLPSQK